MAAGRMTEACLWFLFYFNYEQKHYSSPLCTSTKSILRGVNLTQDLGAKDRTCPLLKTEILCSFCLLFQRTFHLFFLSFLSRLAPLAAFSISWRKIKEVEFEINHESTCVTKEAHNSPTTNNFKARQILNLIFKCSWLVLVFLTIMLLNLKAYKTLLSLIV